jgi:hypothetical protein
MKKILILNVLIFFWNVLAQSTISVNQVLQPFGLQDRVITSLAMEQIDYVNLSNISEDIFVGTENGVFRTSTDEENPQWISLGLKDKNITALTVQHYNAIARPPDGLRLFAAVTPNYLQGDSVLIFRREIHLLTNTNWIAADSGINKNFYNNPNRIIALSSYHSGSPSGTVIAGSEHGIYQTNSSGFFWTQSEIGGTISYPEIKSIDVSPHWAIPPGGIAWAAGIWGLSSAVFRSTDQGNTWSVSYLSLIEDYIPASSVAINTRNPDSVYVAWRNYLYLTPNSGESWEVLLSTRSGEISTVAVDPQHPENVLAGAWFIDDSHQNPYHAMFFHSKNGGKDWDQVDPVSNILLESITSITVLNKLDDKNTYVFIGTAGTGVWRYEYPIITDITENKNIPEQFILYQNYPNPFNPVTHIKYSIPHSSDVSLKVYNLLGEEVATLFEGYRLAGNYEVVFDGSEFASGVYFYRIKASNFIDTKKLILFK